MRNGQKNRGLIYSASDLLLGAGMAFLLMAGAAQAQVVTGTVTCDLLPPADEQGVVTLEKAVYSVAYDVDTNTVAGRWGAGKDITYG